MFVNTNILPGLVELAVETEGSIYMIRFFINDKDEIQKSAIIKNYREIIRKNDRKTPSVKLLEKVCKVAEPKIRAYLQKVWKEHAGNFDDEEKAAWWGLRDFMKRIVGREGKAEEIDSFFV